MHRFLPVALIAMSFMAGPIIAVAATSPGDDPVKLVLFPPWTDGWNLVRQADGRVVGPMAAPLAIFATDDDGAGVFATRLRRAGAWAVLDGTVLAEICGVG